MSTTEGDIAEGDIFEVEGGRKMRAVSFDQFRCANCECVTLTGLCGCSQSQPVVIDRTIVGLPLEAEEAVWGGDAQ